MSASLSVPLTLLLIDDSPSDRTLCTRYLRTDRESYTIIEAETGEEALSICRECQPDIILLDYFLPDYDGLDLFPLIQQTLGTATAPTILLTGHGDTAIVREAMHVGVQDYLVKDTITPNLLQRTLTKVLEQWHMQKKLERQQAQQQLVKQCALRMLHSLDLTHILTTTVESLKVALGVDRAIVIQFAPDQTSRVVAESHADRWASCLHQHLSAETWIPDPDPDIIEEALSKEHWDNQSFFATYPLAVLNRWQVQSLCVVPIWAAIPTPPSLPQEPIGLRSSLADPKLSPDQTLLPAHLPWGLLMVHQCSHSRSWSAIEMDLLQELGVHLAIAIRQAELHRRQEQINSQLQLQLRRNQAQAQAILRACPDLVVHLDRQGHYLDFINGRDRGVLLPPKTPLSANTVWDVLPEVPAQQYMHHIALALDTDTLQVYQHAIVVEDQWVCEEVRIVPCGPGDEVLAIVRELSSVPLSDAISRSVG